MHKQRILLHTSLLPLNQILSGWIGWFFSGCAVGTLLLVGFLARQPVENNISSIEGFYTPNVQYGAWYLANNGALFENNQLPTLSNYTAGLDYGAIDFTFSYLASTPFILASIKNVEHIGRMYRQTPWQGLILMPLATISLYCMFARLTKRPIQPYHCIILYALTVFPNYPMINWAMTGGTLVAIGWATCLSIFMAMLARYAEPKVAIGWSILFIMLLLFLQPTYHTAALVVTITLFSLWLIQHVTGQKILAVNTLQIVGVIFFTFLIYHAVDLFRDYGRIFVSFLNDYYRGSDTERLRFSLPPSGRGIWLHALNCLAIIVPVIVTGQIALRQRVNGYTTDPYALFIISWVAALLPLSLFLFAWDGIFAMYARILQYGTLFAITSAAYLLATRPSTWPMISGVALICTVASIYLVQDLRVSSSSFLTRDEQSAGQWISEEYGCEDVIFTDFRIGTTSGYQGCFAVIGPTASSLNRAGRIDLLGDLFYNHNPQQAADAIEYFTITTGRSPAIILLSKRFLDPDIGIVLPDTRLKPMDNEQWMVYQSLPGWKTTYENSSVIVLRKDPQTSADIEK